MADPRDGTISHEDLQAVDDFGAFLEDPTSRCGMCLADDHTRPSQCPEVTDEERRRIGIMVMDANMAKRVQRLVRQKEARHARAT